MQIKIQDHGFKTWSFIRLTFRQKTKKTSTTTLQKYPGKTSFLGGELHNNNNNNNKQKAWKLRRRCCLRKTHTRESQLRHQKWSPHLSPTQKNPGKGKNGQEWVKKQLISLMLWESISFIGAKVDESITTFVRNEFNSF
jgi:hypothetical protein